MDILACQKVSDFEISDIKREEILANFRFRNSVKTARRYGYTRSGDYTATCSPEIQIAYSIMGKIAQHIYDENFSLLFNL